MRTSLLKIGVAALLFVSDLVVGTLTAAEIVGIINTMDADLLSIDQTAGDINAVNEAAYLLGTGALYGVQEGFVALTNYVTSAVSQLQDTAPLDAADASMVEVAFGTFTADLDEVLNTMIQKSLVFEVIPIIGANLIAVLRELESALDQFATGLIDVDGGNSQLTDDLQDFIADIDTNFQNTVEAYDGINIPT